MISSVRSTVSSKLNRTGDGFCEDILIDLAVDFLTVCILTEPYTSLGCWILGDEGEDDLEDFAPGELK